MLIIIACSILLLFGVVLAITEYRKRELKDVRIDTYPDRFEKHMVQSYWGISILVISIILPLLAGLLLYFPNLERKGYLESFYYTNALAYQIAVDKTAAYLSQEKFTSKLIAGNIEKLELTTSISDRIAEWRNGVVAYNQILRQYQLYKGNIIIGVFLPPLEDDIKPIVIK